MIITEPNHDVSFAQSPLERVAFTVQLTQLATQVHQVQSYRNDTAQPIEAIYTFPVPLGAVLLGATLVTEGRELVLQVMPRGQAEHDYEEALEDRKAAYRIEESCPGLFTLSAGNLMPGQHAVLHLHWAMLNRWHQLGLNLRLPTTLTPRYGSDVAAGLGGASTPQHSFHADNRCDVEVLVDPAMADLGWQCASHPFAVDRSGDGLRLSAHDLSMSQDIVIRFEQRGTLPTTLHYLADGDAVLAMLAVQGRMPATLDRTPRDLVIVVDCSGSMMGGSIAQAREAASTIIDQLSPGQQVSLIRFGSTVEPLFDRPRRVDDALRSQLHRCVQSMDADLGGTRIDEALRRANGHAIQCPQGADILLLTDGAIYDTQSALRALQDGKARVFTIGIGVAPNEEAVTRIAQLGRGHCEIVGPGEDIVGAVRDQFQRMQSGEPAAIEVKWPAGATAWSPPTRLYQGDAAYVFARCPDVAADGTLSMVTHSTRGGTQFSVTASAAPAGIPATTLVRIAAQEHLRQLVDPAQRLALAIRYQLLCEQTNLLVVDEHSAAGSDAPRITAVQHNMPAMVGARAMPEMLMRRTHVGSLPSPPQGDRRVSFSASESMSDALYARAMPAEVAPDRVYELSKRDTGDTGISAELAEAALRRANQRIARKGLRSLDTSVLAADLFELLQHELASWTARYGELVTIIAILQVMAGEVAAPTLNNQAASYQIPASLLRDVRSALDKAGI